MSWESEQFDAIRDHQHRDGQRLDTILANQEKIMALSKDALAAVTATDSRIDSLIAAFAGIKQALADALAGVTLPPNVQADIDAITSLSVADAAKLDTALNTGTPPAPAATPETPAAAPAAPKSTL